MLCSQMSPLWILIIYTVVLGYGGDASGASSTLIKRCWTTLRIIGRWSCCIPDFVYAIEPGEHWLTLGQALTTPIRSFRPFSPLETYVYIARTY